jgi:hypothetical protein
MNSPSLKLRNVSKKTPHEYGTPDASEGWLTEEEGVVSSENDDSDSNDNNDSSDDSDASDSSDDASIESFLDHTMSDYYTSSGDSDEYSPPNPDAQSPEGSSWDDADLSFSESSTK